MGGAERSARKRRQAQAATGSAPAVTKHKSGDRKKVVIAVVVVVLLAGAVLGGVIYTNSKKNATEGQEIAAKGTTELDDAATGAGEEATYPVHRDGAVVAVGEDSATVTLDVYEDFLCPVCRAFEESYGEELEKHVKDGALRVRYHMLPMLNERSDPPGYSMDSANAGLCAADADRFPAFHTSLFDAQPEEGARGWDKQQLARLGKDLGITDPSFQSCVDSDEYDGILQANLDEVRSTEYLQQDFDGQRGFGTPTVAKGQQVLDTSDPKWLDKALGDAR